MKVDLIDLSGEKEATKVTLSEDIFGGSVNGDLLAQYVLVHRSATRAGTAATKDRGDVRGGGRKPWRQKGTGRARQGSIRAPQWVGGGVAHGPHPKDWTLRLPVKMRRGALLSALADKGRAGKILVIAGFSKKWTKTRELHYALKIAGVEPPYLLVLGKTDKSLLRLGRNLGYLKMQSPSAVAAYDVLRAKVLLFSVEGLREFQEFLLGRGVGE